MKEELPFQTRIIIKKIQIDRHFDYESDSESPDSKQASTNRLFLDIFKSPSKDFGRSFSGIHTDGMRSPARKLGKSVIYSNSPFALNNDPMKILDNFVGVYLSSKAHTNKFLANCTII